MQDKCLHILTQWLKLVENPSQHVSHVMDGPVYIICEHYLDKNEKVLLNLSDTKPNLLSTC